MNYSNLGRTGIKVSGLCFGSLTMTPFQSGLSIEEGAELIRYGQEAGINFIDTAELYENYDYIRAALKGIRREELVIATKTYAYDRSGAKASLDKALSELDTDYIDLFLLHEQESEHTIRGHYEALEYFLEQKKRGVIRAVGISTHRIQGVLGAVKYPQLDVIHPILNVDGIGILDGTIDEMVTALRVAKERGMGIYAMKILGGGHLIPDVLRAFDFINGLPFLDSVAVGMQSKDEIDYNIAMLHGGDVSEDISQRLRTTVRRLIIADHCIGCGNCERACKHDAIRVVEGFAVPNEHCVLCGYCAKYCPDFCIKVI